MLFSEKLHTYLWFLCYFYSYCNRTMSEDASIQYEMILPQNIDYLIFRHEIREDCGTAKPLKRVLTSQLTAAATASSAASSDDETAVEATEGAVDRTTLTANLTATLFPVLIEIYSASAGPGVKHAALQVRDYTPLH